MPDAFDQLPRAAFDFIEFPVIKVVVKGGLREHTHEYPHSPGGSPEKLGRKLYTVQMSALFHNNLLEPWNEDLWPGALATLFDRFDDGLTSTLTIPTVGDIKAFCTNWSREMVAKVRSGESAELEFLEDQSSAYLIEGLVNIRTQSLVTQSGLLLADAEDLGYGDIFKAVAAAIASVSKLVDQAEMYDAVLASKVEAINHSMARFNATLGLLNDPLNAVLLESFMETWRLIAQLQQDLQRQAIALLTFTVPGSKTVTVSDVSRIVYGDTSKAAEILQMNAIPDPFRITPGSKLKLYKPNTLVAAA